MSRRLAVREVVLTALVAVGWLGPVAVAGQGRQATGTGARTSSPGPYTQPKTPDGQPDLQGFWTNSTYTPLERPEERRRRSSTHRRSWQPSIKQAASAKTSRRHLARPPTCTTISAQFGWTGARRHSRENLRTSLIVDPPDGKLPPLTDEGRRSGPPRAPRPRNDWSADGTRPRAISSTIGASSWREPDRRC